jgi:hypothetical protein
LISVSDLEYWLEIRIGQIFKVEKEKRRMLRFFLAALSEMTMNIPIFIWVKTWGLVGYRSPRIPFFISFVIDSAANLETQKVGIAPILLIDENKLKDMIDKLEVHLQTLG